MPAPTEEQAQQTLEALTRLPEKLNLWNILYIAALILVSVIVIKIILTVTGRLLAKSRLDKSLHTFIKSILRIILSFLAILIVLDALGIPITSLVALFSIIGLALSLAAQGVLSNLAGGIMVLWSKPFKVGDFVRVGDISGTVRDVTLVYTKLNATDNRVVYLTNKAVSEATVENYSAESVRRVELTVSASYDSPIPEVKAALLEAVTAQPGYVPDPAPIIGVSEFASSAIRYHLWFWCDAKVYWPTVHGVNETIKATMDARGLQMTYDHLNVHILEK